MRIWLLSDLHLEFADLRQALVIPAADVCVVAGDLRRGIASGVNWLAEQVAHAMPCVYVAGNHEFYKGSIKEGIESGRATAQGFANIHFLENDSVVIGGTRFLGATLWTDYQVEGQQDAAMRYARDRMNDYRQIAEQKKPWSRFVPQVAFRMHEQSRLFIDRALKAEPIKTVVVTHHLPHPRSLPAQSKGDPINAAYVSDLRDVIEAGRPALWIHGHTHASCDYMIGDTRIVCNPRGYADENPWFDPMLVLEV